MKVSQMTNSNEVPEEIAAQVEVLYQALLQCPDLLKVGRRHGLRVGITEGLAALIEQRHGNDAGAIVSNCLPIAG